MQAMTKLLECLFLLTNSWLTVGKEDTELYIKCNTYNNTYDITIYANYIAIYCKKDKNNDYEYFNFLFVDTAIEFIRQTELKLNS